MNERLVLNSTLLLTLLLLLGLFFFVKASVKDRTQQMRFVSEDSEEKLAPALQTYLGKRAYRIVSLDNQQQMIKLTGVVRPSLFLAILLTLLVGIGLLCLGLVVSLMLPQVGDSALVVVLLTPAATIFYWQQAGRSEQITLQIKPLSTPLPDHPQGQSLLTIAAHRDELRQLQTAMKLEPIALTQSSSQASTASKT